MRPRRAAIICILLSLGGLGISAYLEYLHIALLRGELVGGAACGALGSMFNCHAVTASRFGTVLGMPLALWGILGYLTTLGLSLIAAQFPEWTARALSAIVVLALAFVVVDAVLLVTMLTKIGYLCILCLSTYVVNLGLLLAAKLASPTWPSLSALGAWLPQPRSPVVWGFWAMLLTGIAGIVGANAAVMYVIKGPPGSMQKDLARFIQQKPPVVVATTGDPRLGPPDAPFQIVEFSDFLCPSCQRAWQFNPIILAGHRRDVSLVFKNFPLDQECNISIQRTLHPGACRVAAAGECAHDQGKFWEFQDLVFKDGPSYKASNLEGDAARLGLNMDAFRACLANGQGMERVKQDIAEATRLSVNRPPTYIVNGVVVEGLLSPVMFDEFLDTLREKP